MRMPLAPHEKRERLLKLGTLVRARIYKEIECVRTLEGDVVDAIVYPGPEVSVYDNSADDD